MVKIPKLKVESYQPLRDVIFETLRKAIINGEIKPGERLMEVAIAEQMGVSRTPVREAIRRLEAEGLVTMVPRKGTHVSELSAKDIIDVLEVRGALDKLATSLAAKRMKPQQLRALESIHKQFVSCVEKENIEGAVKKDIEFHDAIYAASGNSRLIGVLSTLKEHIYRFRVIYLRDMNIAEYVEQEHEEILNALREGNDKLAGELSEKHIKNQMNAIVEALSQKKL
jgi:transcriptional regulator, GntR family